MLKENIILNNESMISVIIVIGSSELACVVYEK